MKTVLITGATRGIGLATAKQLLEQGSFVYLGCRNIENGISIEKQFKEQGFTNIKAVAIDVTDPAAISAAKQVIENGQGKLDVLINNAGILGVFPQSTQETTVAAIREVFDTNFFGAIEVTQTFLSLLKQSDQPRITNITSGLASLTLHSDPSWMYHAVKTAAYGPSKTALNAYTIALAHDLKDTKVKVNVVDPGYTATDFNDHAGSLTPEHAAAFVIKHTITGDDCPTGQYFSNDIREESGVSPW